MLVGMDEEVAIQARRQAALLHSLGLPGAAAEIEAFCGPDNRGTDSELDSELRAVLYDVHREDSQLPGDRVAG